MVRGIGKIKSKKKDGLITDKEYITEAYLQGGKAVGEITKRISNKKKINK